MTPTLIPAIAAAIIAMQPAAPDFDAPPVVSPAYTAQLIRWRAVSLAYNMLPAWHQVVDPEGGVVTDATMGGLEQALRSVADYLGLMRAQANAIEQGAPPPTPSADLNGDGKVDGADLSLLLGQWGER